jgi:hypothetical protein
VEGRLSGVAEATEKAKADPPAARKDDNKKIEG